MAKVGKIVTSTQIVVWGSGLVEKLVATSYYSRSYGTHTLPCPFHLFFTRACILSDMSNRILTAHYGLENAQ